MTGGEKTGERKPIGDLDGREFVWAACRRRYQKGRPSYRWRDREEDGGREDVKENKEVPFSKFPRIPMTICTRGLALRRNRSVPSCGVKCRLDRRSFPRHLVSA